MKYFYTPSTNFLFAPIDPPTDEEIAAYPEGTFETSPRPDPDYNFDGSEWVAITDAEKRDAFRQSAIIAKTDLSRAFVSAGYMTHEEARSAVIGQWPDTKGAWLAGMTTEQRQNFELDLAGATTIRRNYEHLNLVAGNAGITAEQLDAIFGYAG